MWSEDSVIERFMGRDFNVTPVANTTSNLQDPLPSPSCFICTSDLLYGLATPLDGGLPPRALTPPTDNNTLGKESFFPMYLPCFEFDEYGPLFNQGGEMPEPYSPSESLCSSLLTSGGDFSECSLMAPSRPRTFCSTSTATQEHEPKHRDGPLPQVDLLREMSASATHILGTKDSSVVDDIFIFENPALTRLPRKRPSAPCRLFCIPCDRAFTRLSDFKRHKTRTLQHQPPIMCSKCGTSLSPRRDGLRRHEKICSGEPVINV